MPVSVVEIGQNYRLTADSAFASMVLGPARIFMAAAIPL
jgi:hypothetical protein